jgi:hypothetical protein
MLDWRIFAYWAIVNVSYFGLITIAKMFGATFGWDTFWAIFLQIHLVTLAVCYTNFTLICA